MTMLPDDRRVETDRAFALWRDARSKREGDSHLVRLWELCRPEIARAVQDMARGESSLGAWLDRRGLTFEEVATAVYPAVEDAASRYDPGHESGASFATFAMNHIKGEVARIAKDSHPLAGAELPEDRPQVELPLEEEILDFADVVALIRKHRRSKIVENVYQATKYPDEYSSEALRQLADLLQEKFAEELERDAKLRALHSSLVAMSIRAEDYEGKNGARPGTAEYLLEQHALTCGITQQHRNKVAWQASKVLETCLGSNEERRVLSIACGGSRDLRSIQSLLKATPVQLLLNDLDADALAHSVKSLPHLEGKLRPVPGNAFSSVRTLKALGPYDLVVAGGLFDYLSDRQIEWLLDKLARCLKIGGSICFTNIAVDNLYRPWMDYLTSWRLIERSEADFVTLIRGINPDISMEVDISRDQTGLTHLVELTRIA